MRLLFTSLLQLLITSALAQSLFENTYGTLGAEERAFDMVILDDGSVITAGDRYETSTFERTGYLLKVDADGNEQWNRQLTGNADLFGTTICLLPNGNVLAAGYDYDVPNQDYGMIVAEYQSGNGLPVYQETHEFSQNTEAVAVVPMADNGAIVLCEFGTSSDHTNLLCRINAVGDTLWTKTYDVYPNSENPSGLVLLNDGVVIAGSVTGQSTGTENLYFIKTDFDGNQIWENEDQSWPPEIAGRFTVDPNGGFFATATSQVTGMSFYKIIGMHVSETGVVGWREMYSTHTDRFDLGYDVAAMPDGGAVFVGSAHRVDSTNFRDLVLIRTDASGNEIWTRFYGDFGSETGYRVMVDGEHIIASGKADVDNSEDIFIVKADFDGNTVGIHELPDGSQFKTFPNPTSDFLTILHPSILQEVIDVSLIDLTGRQIWNSTFQKTNNYNLSTLPNGMYLLRLGNETLTRVVISR